MIARILHLSMEQNRQINGHLQKEGTTTNNIDTRTFYDILDQNCKDTDLYSYVKQFKSKQDDRGIFYAIHARWQGPNHVIGKFEAEVALQTLTCDGKKKVWNWVQYFSYHFK